MSKHHKFIPIIKERTSIFYLLALVSLLVFAYYHSTWVFSIIIPIYGFILLLTKRRNLQFYHQAKRIQKAIGILIVFGSFFVYYAIVPFLPSVTFYTTANYVIYLFGLCLTFFEVSALKEIVSSIFLIAAATSGSSISDELEPYLSLYVTVPFAYLVQGIMNSLGVKATIHNSTSRFPVISFPTSQGGQFTAVFNWYCVGVSSLLIFSIILVILLIEEHNNLRSKMIWSIIGIAGILILNILRVVIILLADYFYGAEVGGTIHYIIGYAIFILWLTIFLYLFSKRTIQPRASKTVPPVTIAGASE